MGVRVVLLASVLGVLVLASGTLQPGTASAASSVGRADSARPILVPTDYCGTDLIDVPDQGPYFNFGSSCATHDQCYMTGGSEADRYACDRAFLTDMTASCNAMWPLSSALDLSQLRSRRICYAYAYTYYVGVRLGGSTYFNYYTPV